MKVRESAFSVARLLEARAASAGDRVAYGHGQTGATLRYATLARDAATWRQRLSSAAIGPGHRVGILVHDPLAFASLYLSLLAAEVTVIPIDPHSPPGQVGARLEMFGVDLVVTDQADLTASCPVWGVDGKVLMAQPISSPRTPGPAVLLASSGTTGTPKVMPLYEHQLLYVARQIAQHHQLRPTDRGYSPLPLFHINAQVVGLLATLTAGASLVLDDRFHRTGFWERLESWRVTWCNAVPAILAILVRCSPPPVETARRIRFMRTASAPLPTALQSRFQAESGISVLETYGMSEAASQITANPLDSQDRRPGSVGLPAGVELRVVDLDGRPCPAGQIGSVEIRGQSVIDDYVIPGSVESTRPARNHEGWLVSGDLGHLDQDGFLHLAGRADDVINRGGEKVHPREIEEVLITHPDVAETVVVGKPDPVLGESAVAYVLAGDNIQPADLAQELRSRCMARLAPSSRPSRILVVESLPKGPTGKIVRRGLADETPLNVKASLAMTARAS